MNIFISSWLVEGLVMALATVILDTFSYFTFHKFHLHSLYKGFLGLFLGGEECIIVEKKSDFRTVHICCFEDICIFVMC